MTVRERARAFVRSGWSLAYINESLIRLGYAPLVYGESP